MDPHPFDRHPKTLPNLCLRPSGVDGSKCSAMLTGMDYEEKKSRFRDFTKKEVGAAAVALARLLHEQLPGNGVEQRQALKLVEAILDYPEMYMETMPVISLVPESKTNYSL